MVLSHQRRTIGIFSSHQAAGQALDQLRAAGFPMAQVTLISQDTVPNRNSSNDKVMTELVAQAQQGATTGSVQGLVTGNKIGSVAGLVLGISTLAIPGVGHAILAASAGTIIAFALSSGAIGAVSGGLIGGLVGLGVTEAQVKRQSESLSQGNYLLTATGTDDEIYLAESILSP
ncbi:MAG: hypothetical protein JOZ78_07025 [Chroococcidiopsidaceae cyanobacterium CP_BM_ER_R8_30]|nr:hypothetical protein [Chroococcidiopsidaceae cyanobacterium CP_BM_ER_R8_30]